MVEGLVQQMVTRNMYLMPIVCDTEAVGIVTRYELLRLMIR
ncbi:hypothetical protein ETAA8_40130 [Anatilimnocola aggregata]|uniref:CBS domain-containing protein n=2 Tax=Anatilimnocola aggregata TaxID=2528021 RepID=A0A517YF97_9BACT|nr:hypothetical protein ETAA8_40130 [Anatilimnocola aggregata]